MEEDEQLECLKLKALCLRQVSKCVELENHRMQISSLQELPFHLLEDLAPVLSVIGLARLHSVLYGKGIDVQRYWKKFYFENFIVGRDPLSKQCPCHDPKLANQEWRQRVLDRKCQRRLLELGHRNQDETGEGDSQSVRLVKILQNPFYYDNPKQTRGPLGGFSPSSLLLESRILPYFQKSEQALLILQKNLSELVVSHYLPKYKDILRRILGHLINRGVLRKFTLKHPKCLTPDELFSILEVCTGRHDDIGEQDGCEQEERGCLKRKNTNGFLPGAKCCDSLRRCSESGRIREDAHTVQQSYQGPSQEDVDSAERHQDLYDFCFSEPIDPSSSSYQDVRYLPSLPLFETSKEVPFTCAISDAGSERSSDAVFSESPRDTQSSDTADTRSWTANTRSWTANTRSWTANSCIQHLVLCGFTLHQPGYSQMLKRVLSAWPGLRELEFIDNLMLQNTCHRLLIALIGVKAYGRSLRRLRIEDSIVENGNLPLLNVLLTRFKLDTLELKGFDICFPTEGPLEGRDDNECTQYSLDPLGEAFSQLSALEVSCMCNPLLSLTCLERTLLKPDCVIRYLNLEGCHLGTKMLDRFFVCAKDCKSLHELKVAWNTYCPSLVEQGSGNGPQASLSGLVELIQTSPLTKLNLSGCQFALKGWTHAKEFVKALRLNTSLRHLILINNDLTNECLRLLVDAFISPLTKTDARASKLCLDISCNAQITNEGLDAFSRALQTASMSSGYRLTPPHHLTITSNGSTQDLAELGNLARLVKLTDTWEYTRLVKLTNTHRLNYGDLMLEHLSQM